MAFRDVEMCAVNVGDDMLTEDALELPKDQVCGGVAVNNCCTMQNGADIRSTMKTQFYVVNEVLAYRLGPTRYTIENEVQASRLRRNGVGAKRKKHSHHRKYSQRRSSTVARTEWGRRAFQLEP